MNFRKIRWEKIKISDAPYESAGVFDVDGDGVLDIVSGAYWYKGPDYQTRYKICDLEPQGEYYDDFSTIAMDINGNGRLDFVTGGWWGCKLFWRENPGNTDEWQTHVIAETGNIETTRAWDIDGDGELEICPNTPGASFCAYKLIRDANGKGTGEFKKIVISEAPVGHGLGFGDVNGDGRGDFVCPTGWYEAPANPLEEPWIFHQEFNCGWAGSVPMIIEDIDGDGFAEIIHGNAHGYGLWYMRQHPNANNGRTWTRHPIDPGFSQYHDMIWCDIDGDGINELVTGNRYRAHCGNDVGECDTLLGLYYFKWNGESFTKQVIDHGPFGEHSGTGIFMSIGDYRKTGRLDIVAPGKEGLFYFRNLGLEGDEA